VIKLWWPKETVGSVSMVSNEVESDCVDESDGTSRSHRVDGQVIVSCW
jgi:hypothetical protein